MLDKQHVMGAAAEASEPALVASLPEPVPVSARSGDGQAQWRGCTVPPKGWWCTRKAGHDGPCAARRVETDAIAAAMQVWKDLPDDERNGERPWIQGFNAGWEAALEASSRQEERLREALDAEDAYWAASRVLAASLPRLREGARIAFETAEARRTAARAALEPPHAKDAADV